MDELQKSRPKCLIVIPNNEYIDVNSLKNIINMIEPMFTIQICSPSGGKIKCCKNTLDANEMNEIEKQAISFEVTEPNDFSLLIIPSFYGCLFDLSNSDRLGYIIIEMIASERIVCCLGYGVAALLSIACKHSSPNTSEWLLCNYSLTGPTLTEEFNDKPDGIKSDFYLESKLRLYGATYSCSHNTKSEHVIVDGNLITAQNLGSSNLAINIAILRSKKSEL